MSKNRLSVADIFFLISVLWMNAGVVRIIRSFNATVLFAVFFCAIILTCIQSQGKIETNKLTSSGLLYGLVFVATLAMTVIFIYNKTESEFTEILYAIVLLITQIYVKDRPDNVKGYFVYAILIDSIAININTIRMLFISDELSRIFASGSEAVLKAGYDTFLLGNYGYIYSLVIILLFLLARWKDVFKAPILEKVVIFTFGITSIITIVMAQYTIAILVLVFGGVFSVVFSNGVSLKTTFMTIVICTIVVLLVDVALSGLIENQVFGRIVTDRLAQLQALFNGSVNSESDTKTRLALYERTVKFLPRSLLIGIYETIKSPRVVLGMHTEWLDRLAIFGIFRYALYIIFLFKSIRYSLPKSIIKHKYIVLIIVLVLVGFVNPIMTQNMYLSLFIIIPFLLNHRGEEEMCKC